MTDEIGGGRGLIPSWTLGGGDHPYNVDNIVVLWRSIKTKAPPSRNLCHDNISAADGNRRNEHTNGDRREPDIGRNVEDLFSGSRSDQFQHMVLLWFSDGRFALFGSVFASRYVVFLNVDGLELHIPEEKEMSAKKPLPDVDPKVTIQQRLFGVSWCSVWRYLFIRALCPFLKFLTQCQLMEDHEGEATYIPTSLSSNLPYFYLIGREIVLIVVTPDTSINLLQPMTYRNGLKESSLITESPPRKTSQPLIIRPFTTPESLELSKIHLKETKKSLNKGTESGGEALVKGYDLNPDSDLIVFRSKKEGRSLIKQAPLPHNLVSPGHFTLYSKERKSLPKSRSCLDLLLIERQRRLIQKLLSHDQDSSLPRANLITSLSISDLAYRSVGFYPPGHIQRISQEKKSLSRHHNLFYSLLSTSLWSGERDPLDDQKSSQAQSGQQDSYSKPSMALMKRQAERKLYYLEHLSTSPLLYLNPIALRGSLATTLGGLGVTCFLDLGQAAKE
ncbi:hypothetical protein L6452_42154 [Arctium lappa]|uniref:Uncharacterized protein n=1 Tax=Arctium lappa TaxID=4217 RepID=A0ACB8XHP9_ARCLA|nr:hypothetical protein L6452_42154 [Arctium lappa]